jgi:hypothetical protein
MSYASQRIEKKCLVAKRLVLRLLLDEREGADGSNLTAAISLRFGLDCNEHGKGWVSGRRISQGILISYIVSSDEPACSLEQIPPVLDPEAIGQANII